MAAVGVDEMKQYRQEPMEKWGREEGIGSGRWNESRTAANGKADSLQVLYGQRVAKAAPALLWFL